MPFLRAEGLIPFQTRQARPSPVHPHVSRKGFVAGPSLLPPGLRAVGPRGALRPLPLLGPRWGCCCLCFLPGIVKQLCQQGKTENIIFPQRICGLKVYFSLLRKKDQGYGHKGRRWKFHQNGTKSTCMVEQMKTVAQADNFLFLL